MSALFAIWLLCADPAAASPVPASTSRNVPTQVAFGGHAAAANGKPDHAARSKPSMTLIGFLGDYADAGDGLDPMGLAEHPEVKMDHKKVDRKP
ncbi:MAG TPA: hypothetical protein VFN13_06860 [Rudaea sp.]|nr:hypothetical protein [Rudaea sp.]